MISILFTSCPWWGKSWWGPGRPTPICPSPSACFPDPEETRAMLAGLGFTQVSYRRLTNGIAVIHLGVKA